MSINLVVAITDGDWFDMLRQQPNLAEVNFWAPSSASFRALQQGELFLFKLHAPRNVIVGGGIFAWQAHFRARARKPQEANGARSARNACPHRTLCRAAPADRSDFEVGCRTDSAIFLRRSDWIAVPASWSPNMCHSNPTRALPRLAL